MVADLYIPDRMGGSEIVIKETSKSLIQSGHNVYILAGRYGERVLRENKEGVKIYRFPIIKINLFLSLMSIYINVRKFLDELTSKIGFDLIILHHPYSALPVVSSGLCRHIPKVYVFYGPAYQEWLIEYAGKEVPLLGKFMRPLFMPAVSTMLKKIQKYALNHSNQIVVLSEFSRKQVEDHFDIKHKTTMVPGGVDTERFKPTNNRSLLKYNLGVLMDRTIFLTVRRLVPRMGIENLILAMSKVVRENNNVLLLIGGKGILEKRLKRLCNSLQLDEYVKFLGFIDDNKLPLYYQIADCFILPTLDLEGFGLTTLEALSCGTPVLGTPKGATVEILGVLNKNLLFEGTAPSQMAKLMLSFAKERPKNKEESRIRCRDFVLKNYSWEKSIAEWRKLIDSI